MDTEQWAKTQAEDLKKKVYKHAVKQMKNITKEVDGDEEDWHGRADRILCDFLSFLGYKELVDAFKEVPKWYA